MEIAVALANNNRTTGKTTMLSVKTRKWMERHEFEPLQINRPGKYDDTALIHACRQGEAGIASELIEAGADIHHRNMDGTNALWACVVSDSFDLASTLLAIGANLDNQNDNGATVLMYAASAGKTEWVKFFLAQGANTRLTSLDDFSALDLASNVDCLKMLRAVR